VDFSLDTGRRFSARFFKDFLFGGVFYSDCFNGAPGSTFIRAWTRQGHWTFMTGFVLAGFYP